MYDVIHSKFGRLKITAGFALLLTGSMLLSAPLAAQDTESKPEMGRSAVVKSGFEGTILTLTPRLEYDSATVRVVGPDGYEARGQFKNGQFMTVGLLADRMNKPETNGDTGQLKENLELSDGQYVYEARFQRADGSIATADGVFYVIDGVAQKRHPHSSNEEIEGPLSRDKAGSNVGTKSLDEDDDVSVFDTQADDFTSFSLDETGGSNEEWWAMVNDDTVFKLWSGFPGDDGTTSGGMEVSVLQNGNVGINTAAPAEPLHVNGNADTAVRIEDSTAAGLSAWNLQVNGTSGLEFEDTETGNEVVTFIDGAPPDSLYLNSVGRLGLGTPSPQSTLDVRGTLTVGESTLDGIAITDGTNSWLSRLDFSNNLDFLFDGSQEVTFASDGSVGIGVSGAPSKQLHVQGSDTNQLGQNNVMLQVENTVGDQGPRRMIELINNGSPLLVYKDTARGTIWNMSPVGNSFAISLSGTGAQEFLMDGDGNAEFQGDVTANGVVLDSSRALKTDFTPVDTHTVLKKVAALDVTQWRYKDEAGTERHIGPMAEDFQRIFGLGDGKHIELVDTTGVTLAAVKALQTKAIRLEAENRDLREELAALKSAVAELQTRSR